MPLDLKLSYLYWMEKSMGHSRRMVASPCIQRTGTRSQRKSSMVNPQADLPVGCMCLPNWGIRVLQRPGLLSELPIEWPRSN